MVDRVYIANLPRIRKALERLREDYSTLNPQGTNWVKLRIEPLLKHVVTLEQFLNSQEFSREFAHLRKGVVFFHSDLVYFRTNVKELEKMLETEKRSSKRKKNSRG